MTKPKSKMIKALMKWDKTIWSTTWQPLEFMNKSEITKLFNEAIAKRGDSEH